MNTPGIRHKRRHFFVLVHDVPGQAEPAQLSVTMDTTAGQVIHQTLARAGRSEPAGDWLLVEEVQRGWERARDVPRASAHRVLGAQEKVLQAQNRWRGQGRWLLKQRREDPHIAALRQNAGEEGGEWEDSDAMFICCVYDVAHDVPYAILQAPVSSTALDIVAQVCTIML